MIQRDYLIIGGGIGGGSVCESIRKYDKRGSVTLVGAEILPPYKRWMLSKTFLRDKTPPMKKLPLLDEHWYDAHKIETRFGSHGDAVQYRSPPGRARERRDDRVQQGLPRHGQPAGASACRRHRTGQRDLSAHDPGRAGFARNGESGKDDRGRRRRIAGLRSGGQPAPDEIQGQHDASQRLPAESLSRSRKRARGSPTISRNTGSLCCWAKA